VAIGCLTIHDLNGEISVRATCSVCRAMIGTFSQHSNHEAAPPLSEADLPGPDDRLGPVGDMQFGEDV
jgi:hypothetical protein